MSTVKLDQAFLNGAVASTNFFNGRLLSAEDLRREQEAVRIAQERLGTALGAGVVAGFEVEAKSIGGSSVTDPVVIVKPGLAIAEDGETVALDREVEVSLLAPGTATSTAPTSMETFRACAEGTRSTVYVAGSGVYLLAAAPAEGTRGLAMVSGLGNRPTTCNAKETLTGVLFKMVQVKMTDTELADPDRLRNIAAYKFFLGEGAGTADSIDPLGPQAVAPVLTEQPLNDCDVPLALIHWTSDGGIRWVDLWSVRRSVKSSPDGYWPRSQGLKRSRVGEAMLFQFMKQMMDFSDLERPRVRAIDYFEYMPPAGFVRIIEDATNSTSQFQLDVFFETLTYRSPTYMEGARLPRLMMLAGSHPPFRLAEKELIWLYYVRENAETIAAGTTPKPRPYVVFSSGHLPYQAYPRFDLARWDYSNYSSVDL
jgi:hypothetical protein